MNSMQRILSAVLALALCLGALPALALDGEPSAEGVMAREQVRTQARRHAGQPADVQETSVAAQAGDMAQDMDQDRDRTQDRDRDGSCDGTGDGAGSGGDGGNGDGGDGGGNGNGGGGGNGRG